MTDTTLIPKPRPANRRRWWPTTTGIQGLSAHQLRDIGLTEQANRAALNESRRGERMVLARFAGFL